MLRHCVCVYVYLCMCVCIKVLKEELKFVDFFPIKMNEIATILKTHKISPLWSLKFTINEGNCACSYNSWSIVLRVFQHKC